VASRSQLAAIIVAGTALLLPFAVSAQTAGILVEEALVPSPIADLVAEAHLVPVTIYRPDDALTRPTLLWGHGWSGSRADSAGDGQWFAERGYNVVAMDFRGHGDARTTSFARVHDLNYEIRDTRAVIDWIANQPWAALDQAGDPRLGALGGSYGGGYQLLTASQDQRLDAIAPEITWNDLVQALAPNRVIRSAWNDLLYGAGVALANLDPFIHESFLWGTTMNELPDSQLPGEPNAVGQFTGSSPSHYPGAIAIPTLLIQGVSDTLFNLNQAVHNREQIGATGSPVKLVTHLGGHLLPALQPADGGEPCGDHRLQILAWYDKHLKGLAVDTGPEIEMGLDDGTCLTSLSEPDLLDAPPTPVLLGGANLTGPTPGASVDLSIPQVHAGDVLAGLPRLEGRITIPLGPEAIVFFSLVAKGASGERVLAAQVTPLRRKAGGVARFDLELAGVASRLRTGESLVLRVRTFEDQFAQNGARTPFLAALTNLALELPVH
jgi:predicted alpha/beta-fold hydrolase